MQTSSGLNTPAISPRKNFRYMYALEVNSNNNCQNFEEYRYNANNNNCAPFDQPKGKFVDGGSDDYVVNRNRGSHYNNTYNFRPRYNNKNYNDGFYDRDETSQISDSKSRARVYYAHTYYGNKAYNCEWPNNHEGLPHRNPIE